MTAHSPPSASSAASVRSLHPVSAAASTAWVAASSPTAPAPKTSVTVPGPRGNLGMPATHITPPGSTYSPRTAGGTPRGQPRPRLDRSTATSPKGGAPLWLGIRKVGREDPAAVLVALSRAGRMHAQLALPVPNFGAYLAQRAAKSRLQPVSAGRLRAAPGSPRAVDSDGNDSVRPGQSGNEHVGAGFGYHAPSPPPV